MIYEVENLPKHVSLLQLDRILCYTLDALGLHQEAFLLIRFEHDLEENLHGFFDYDEIENELYISICHSLREEDMIRTIIHELIHARQILTGQYVPGEGKFRGTWYGIEYNCNYDELPWEKEAYALEEEIYVRYSTNML